jgi:plastocyanin
MIKPFTKFFGKDLQAKQQGPRKSSSTAPSAILGGILLFVILSIPQLAQAQWRALVGAQTNDKGRQALSFLPNEIWIHAGDNITWRFDVDEIHTVTFLKADQPRPFFVDGCPGFSSSPAVFDGSTCVTTPPLAKGNTFTVNFPAPGNFKLTCLVHENMSGVIHALNVNQPLPHDQAFYDREAADRRRDLLNNLDWSEGHNGHSGHLPSGVVTAGTGEVSATAGGFDTLSVVRFRRDPTEIHAGQTVEWTNLDPVLPHTITFGGEPQGDPFPPSSNVTVDADGARHAVVNSPSDIVHSGFIVAAPQERLGLPQSPLSFTRFRVTFPHAGTFPYICALHDNLGMKGKVIVRP